MMHVFKTEKYENNFTMKCFDWHAPLELTSSFVIKAREEKEMRESGSGI